MSTSKSAFGASAYGNMIWSTATAPVKKELPKTATPAIKPYPLQLVGFAGCCGAYILYGFPTDPLKKELKEQRINEVDAALNKYDDYRTGSLKVMLNDLQFYLEPTLEKHGWKREGTFKNPNTYRTISQWTRIQKWEKTV